MSGHRPSLARAEQTIRVRVARDELRRICELSRMIMALEKEVAALVADIAPQLLDEPGIGPLTAAKLVGEIAGAGRFKTDAKLARAAGLAPIPVSSGKTTATDSTAAATDRSMPPSTASRSHAPAATRKPRTTSLANAPKARPPRSHPQRQAPPRPPHLAPPPAAPHRHGRSTLKINFLT